MYACGSRLKEERERLQLSQADFARVAGVHRNAQGNYESGARLPDAEYLAAIAGQGADVLYIVTGERGSAGNLSQAESHLVEAYRQLAQQDRAVFDRVVHALVQLGV